ncbi:MarR family winged helix-turn-helix transcriptional regulator [Nocardioides massiliensis]|uniref:DNA-binding MarR family transcriptional regulator n=1 Tax=Nocardioides massiliensis TaxID=1325935 RepID=A0ABT9NLN9_9ACTN|nr:MarR family transcriptional regulator [Nocardioides massiliensis]MDP9821251.1 DNA-binding MarR family transcriptional regulator [Nocardioides massiliensis]
MPTPEETTTAVEAFIRNAFAPGRDPWIEAFVEIDLTFNQARTLMVLEHTAHPMPIGQIAQLLGLTLPSAGRNVDRLVRLDLVERHEDPEDRRVKLVELTAKGRELVDLKVDCHRASTTSFLADHTDEDRAALVAALRPFIRQDDPA